MTKSKENMLTTEQLELLEKLSNAIGVSGEENEVREIVEEVITPFVDEVYTDVMGSLIACKKCEKEGAMRLMLVAHLDEVGFMVTVNEENGLFQFENVGQIDPRQLPGKPVLIGTEKIPAVIGARAIHLTTAEQRKAAIPPSSLRFDTGLGKGAAVQPGDRASFATEFFTNDTSVFGKALDNRLGVLCLIELLKNPPADKDLYFVFASQKEIGGRGEMVSATNINPDAAILIDSSVANDLPHFDDEQENTVYESKLGEGPAVYPMYGSTISDPRLFAFMVQSAEKHEINHQTRQPTSTRNRLDGFHAVHKQLEGIPTLNVSVPGRYPHTAMGVAYQSDILDTIKLLDVSVKELSKDVIKR